MSTDWKKEIAIAWSVQNEIAKLDSERIWEYHLPRVAASEKELDAAEASLGIALDARYRDFLKFANGWPCFYRYVDLFGTTELMGGALIERAKEAVAEMIPGVFAQSGVVKSELFPFAVSRNDRDVFVITRPPNHNAGSVIWFAGYEIQRFPTFDEFFLAMVDYNRLHYQRFVRGEMPRIRR